MNQKKSRMERAAFALYEAIREEGIAVKGRKKSGFPNLMDGLEIDTLNVLEQVLNYTRLLNNALAEQESKK